MKRGNSDTSEDEQQKQRRRLTDSGEDGKGGGFKCLVEAAESQENVAVAAVVGEEKAKQKTVGGSSKAVVQETNNDDIDGENESQEASDVAFVASVRPKSPTAAVAAAPAAAIFAKPKKDVATTTAPTTKKQTTKPVPVASTKAGACDEGTEAATHPNPKNFAERLMFALEKGMGSSVILWAGGGAAVAIHPKKLKKDNILESHFRVKNYGAFIRNCNRWGFKRVNCYAVPDGQVTYECSLFRKDQPHLVKHMRMDSDVQDVFARHHVEEKNQSVDNRMQPQSFQNQIIDSKPAAAARGMDSISHQRPRQPIGMSVNFLQQQPPPPPQSQQMLSSLMGQMSQQMSQSGQGNAQGQSSGLFGQPQQDGNLLSTLLSTLFQGQNSPPPPANDPERMREEMLGQILQLSGEYLIQPLSDTPYDATLRTVLQLLQNHGAPGGGASVQQHSQPQAQSIPSFPPAVAASTEDTNHSDVVGRLQAVLSGNDGQSQALASTLQQLLMTQEGGASGNTPQIQPPHQSAPVLPPAQPQRQQQQQLPQQLHQQPNVQPSQEQQVPNTQELLMMLLQQQQQQQR